MTTTNTPARSVLLTHLILVFSLLLAVPAKARGRSQPG